jgi:ribosomal protein S27AE
MLRPGKAVWLNREWRQTCDRCGKLLAKDRKTPTCTKCLAELGTPAHGGSPGRRHVVRRR